jgi:hypothetical protein
MNSTAMAPLWDMELFNREQSGHIASLNTLDTEIPGETPDLFLYDPHISSLTNWRTPRFLA